MRFPAYPEYKDSGVAWLGDIPEQWEILRLKNVLQKRITDGPHTTPVFLAQGIPFLSVDGIQDGELQFDGCRYVSEEDHNEYRVKAFPKRDDLLMGKAASTGKIARVKVDFEFSIWSPLALIRLNTEISDPTFVEYLLKSAISQAQIDNFCTSNTQKNISMDDIPKLVLTYPPLEEQRAIAAFLDRETARIDALIAKKQRLIELLQEKRAALISHAVTQGLNPAAPRKDSGIPWLGQIPAHWKIMALKFAARFQRGHDLPAEERCDGRVPIVSSAGVTGLHDIAAAKGPGISTGRYGTIGKFTYVDCDYWPLNTTLFTVDTYENNVRFLWWMLHILEPLFLLHSKKSAVPGVDRNDLHPVRVALPPIGEQIEISEYLTQWDQKYALLSEKVCSVIDRLTEYRASLIAHAVTGKIDVRHVRSAEIPETA